MFHSTQLQFKKCPYCAEMIQADATVCRYCHKAITPQAMAQETADAKAFKQRQLVAALWQLGCGLIVLGLIVPPLIIFLAAVWPK
jgi:hypothetical protein